MTAQPCYANISSFDLSNAFYYSGFCEKVKLKDSEYRVLNALIKHYNAKKEDMYPSQSFMAKKLGLTKRSVANAIVSLRNKGLIIYDCKKCNHYKFTKLFFDLLQISSQDEKFTPNDENLNSQGGKIFTPHDENFSSKQINRTNKKQKENFSKSFNEQRREDSKKKEWISYQQNAPKYKTAEQTKKELQESLRRDEKNPNNDKQTAIKTLEFYSAEDLQNSFILQSARKLYAKWNFTTEELKNIQPVIFEHREDKSNNKECLSASLLLNNQRNVSNQRNLIYLKDVFGADEE